MAGSERGGAYQQNAIECVLSSMVSQRKVLLDIGDESDKGGISSMKMLARTVINSGKHSIALKCCSDIYITPRWFGIKNETNRFTFLYGRHYRVTS